MAVQTAFADRAAGTRPRPRAHAGWPDEALPSSGRLPFPIAAARPANLAAAAGKERLLRARFSLNVVGNPEEDDVEHEAQDERCRAMAEGASHDRPGDGHDI